MRWDKQRLKKRGPAKEDTSEGVGTAVSHHAALAAHAPLLSSVAAPPERRRVSPHAPRSEGGAAGHQGLLEQLIILSQDNH